MLQRFAYIFYTILSITVALGCAGILAGATIAFAAEPEGNRTAFTVSSVTVTSVPGIDPYMGASPDRAAWKRVVIEGSAVAWTYSPYTYSVESFAVKTPASLQNEENVLVYLDAPLAYSRGAPDDFRLYVYLRVDVSNEAVALLVKRMSFTARTVTKAFSEFDSEMTMYLPLLEMSAVPDKVYEIKEPTITAGSFFSWQLIVDSNSFGMCDDCMIASVPDHIIDELKTEQLKKTGDW